MQESCSSGSVGERGGNNPLYPEDQIKTPRLKIRQGDSKISLLTRQGSNLDSSEPKSDVLPITPRVKDGCENRVANIQNF